MKKASATLSCLIAGAFFFASPGTAEAQYSLYQVPNTEAWPTSSFHASPSMAWDISASCSEVPDWRVSRIVASARSSSGTFSTTFRAISTGSTLLTHATTSSFTVTTTYTEFDRNFSELLDLKSACEVARAAGNTELWLGFEGSVRYYRTPISFATQGYLRHSSGAILTHTLSAQLYGTYGAIDWGAIQFPEEIDWTQINLVATSSSLFGDDVDALADIAQRCDDSGNIFSRGLCHAFAYLFVPKPTVLNQYAELPAEISTKFPFSWVFDVRDALTDASGATALVATSTISINFASLGIGSTTAMGNILPNVTVFSEGTVKEYIPPAVWTSLQALMAGGLWLALGWHIYATVRRRHGGEKDV